MHTSPKTTPRFGARAGVVTSLALAGALGLAACGSDGTTTAASPSATEAPGASAPVSTAVEVGPVAPPPASTLPAVGLLNTVDGGEVNLQTVVDGERPLLFWFWAPH